MSDQATPSAYSPPRLPNVRPIGFGDIVGVLKAGLSDFARAPLFGLFFGGIFAAGGLFILAALTLIDLPWMIFPVAIGFPLIGPFVAAGLYEVSRCLAEGRPLKWRDVLLVVVSQRQRQMGWMAFVVLFIFWVWIYQVRLLLALFLGFKSFATVADFITVVTTTTDGVSFLIVGTIVGAVLALILFCATVIAMPLLLDRDLDFVSAIIVSFKAVFASPATMIGWGIAVTVLAILAMAPAFLGLIVVMRCLAMRRGIFTSAPSPTPRPRLPPDRTAPRAQTI